MQGELLAFMLWLLESDLGVFVWSQLDFGHVSEFPFQPSCSPTHTPLLSSLRAVRLHCPIPPHR